MAWIKLDPGFFFNPKARAVGKDGQLLYLMSLCWTASSRTEGTIHARDLPLLAMTVGVDPQVSKLLVDEGLWITRRGGWEIHDYLAYNPTLEAIEELRRTRAEAGRLGGQAPRRPSKPEANRQANAQANGKQK